MPVLSLSGITHACFGLSYLFALVCELLRYRWGRKGLRTTGLLFGSAGLFAHSIYLGVHHPTPATPYGSLLLLAWVLAVFYLYGTVHYTRQAWAIFVLPVVIGLVGLSLILANTAEEIGELPPWLTGQRFGGALHGLLLLLAAVGVSVGFLASIMYLVQARRLRRKRSPLGGMTTLSLERLETMNRRAINGSFPLLTAGLLLGAFLLERDHAGADWLSVKVLGTAGLWLVFLLLLYLRYAVHVPGRQLAWLTVLAFAVLVTVLAASHPFVTGGTP